MRRIVAASTAVLLLALTPATSGAEPGEPRAEVVESPALATAERVLSGAARRTDPSPTLALRDLRLVLARLAPEEKTRSRTLLARPTDPGSDGQFSGYTVPSRRWCSDVVCVHWVSSTRDQPPNRSWVERALDVMTATYRRTTSRMGYRRPLADGRRGGNEKFDFYLKDLGSQGIYGYCAPEREKKQYRYSSYCVVDNDFASAQYGGTPLGNLKVTVGHEFFHAVQYAYDAAEDRWLMESSATWMEERLADGVDDNRQYLRYGQLGRPQVPLDLFEPYGYAHYGNWLFLEYLSQKYGVTAVREIWKRAAVDGTHDRHSTGAIDSYLRTHRSSMPGMYAWFSMANSFPRRTYREGAAYKATAPNLRHTLSSGARTMSTQKFTLDHLTSARVALHPDSTLSATDWRVRLRIDAPDAKHRPQVLVSTLGTGGRLVTERVKLDRSGVGQTVLRFDARSVRTVLVTLANGQIASRCWTGTYFACQGTPRSNNRVFTVSARAFRA